MGLWCPDAQTPSPASTFACNWPDLITAGKYILERWSEHTSGSPFKLVCGEGAVLSRYSHGGCCRRQEQARA